MDLQIRHLEAFVALCEEGTFTRAAARVHVSQPSLSRTIQELERVLDCVLIDRSARTPGPTASGELFLRRSRAILADMTELQAEMRAQTQVRVGFAWLLPNDWFAATRERYEQLGGQLKLLRSDNPTADLRDGAVDVAVVRNVGPVSGSISWRPIGAEKRVLAVSARSSLARTPGLRWADLAHHPLVINTESGTTTPDCWPDSAPGRETVTCRNLDEWIELIAADRGIGAVPALAAHRAPHPEVVYRELPDIPDSTLYLGWRRTPEPSRSTRRFLDAAVELLDPDPSTS
ncbi:LysR family transcriptional regulator [Nocardia sp. NPDC056952]|uniref:LysR family transcriptional regulator n=1 Tax=Nocardia sp. NPDC056952 TaxID=3345979 RepID=UPI00363D75C2